MPPSMARSSPLTTKIRVIIVSFSWPRDDYANRHSRKREFGKSVPYHLNLRVAQNFNQSWWQFLSRPGLLQVVFLVPLDRR